MTRRIQIDGPKAKANINTRPMMSITMDLAFFGRFLAFHLGRNLSFETPLLKFRRNVVGEFFHLLHLLGGAVAAIADDDALEAGVED